MKLLYIDSDTRNLRVLFYVLFAIVLVGCKIGTFQDVNKRASSKVVKYGQPCSIEQLYTDNFDDEQVKQNPSHWIEHNRFNFWKVMFRL